MQFFASQCIYFLYFVIIVPFVDPRTSESRPSCIPPIQCIKITIIFFLKEITGDKHNKPAMIPLRLFMPGVDAGTAAIAFTTPVGRPRNGLRKIVFGR